MLVVKIALGIILAFVIIEVAQLVFALALLGGVARSLPSPHIATAAPVRTTVPPGATPTAPPTLARPLFAVNSWSGTSDLDTPAFVVGSEWYVDFDLPTSGHLLQIDVYNSRTNALVGPVANTKLDQHTVMPQHVAGTFYLRIRADNVAWKVTILDAR